MGLTTLKVEVGNPAAPEIFELDPLKLELKPIPMMLAVYKDKEAVV
jgi:hypothetical protein